MRELLVVLAYIGTSFLFWGRLVASHPGREIGELRELAPVQAVGGVLVAPPCADPPLAPS